MTNTLVVNGLNTRREQVKLEMTRKIAVITLKFEKGGSTIMCLKGADGMANCVDHEQSDLGLHCLPRTHPSENLGTLR